MVGVTKITHGYTTVPLDFKHVDVGGTSLKSFPAGTPVTQYRHPIEQHMFVLETKTKPRHFARLTAAQVNASFKM